MIRVLVERLDRWIASRADDASLPTATRLDRHVLGGAKILAWMLAVSLLGIHLPSILIGYDRVPAAGAVLVAAFGLASLAALWIFGRGERPSDGENLSAVVTLTGVGSLVASSLLETRTLESHVLLAPIPIALLSVAAIAPMRPRRMVALGLVVFGAQLAVAVTGVTGGNRAFHVLTLTFTFNTVLTSALICHVRRAGLEQLIAREAVLRASNARRGELLETLQRAQSQLVASERIAVLGRVGAGLAHELKSPLAAVSNGLLELRGLAQELHESAGHPEVTDDDLKAIAADMMHAIRASERAERRVTRQLDGVVSRTRRSTPPAGVASFAPLREVRTVSELYDHRARQLAVEVEADGDPAVTIQGDRGAFAQVVSHLLDRALRVSAGTRDARVRLTVTRRGDIAVLEVLDSGPTLTTQERERLFRPLADAEEGVGLYVTRDVVEQTFGGVILVTRLPEGNAFAVQVPLRGRDRPPRPTVVRSEAGV